MRFRDWDQYKSRFPLEAGLLEERADDGNKFLTDMVTRIKEGKDLTLNMRKALSNWAGSSATATTAILPSKGDVVTTRLIVTKAERVDGKYGVVNTYKFSDTADGWHGRLETNCTEIEDAAIEAGADFESKGSFNWVVEVCAKTLWVADRKPFVILGGRNVRMLKDVSAEPDATAVVIPPHRPEPPRTVLAPPPQEEAEAKPVLGGDWKKSLGL